MTYLVDEVISEVDKTMSEVSDYLERVAKTYNIPSGSQFQLEAVVKQREDGLFQVGLRFMVAKYESATILTELIYEEELTAIDVSCFLTKSFRFVRREMRGGSND